MCELHLLALQECGTEESVEHVSLVSSLSFVVVVLYGFVLVCGHNVTSSIKCDFSIKIQNARLSLNPRSQHL